MHADSKPRITGTEAKLNSAQVGSKKNGRSALDDSGGQQRVEAEPSLQFSDYTLENGNDDGEMEMEMEIEMENEGGTAVATAGFVLGLGTMIGLGYIYRESIDQYLDIFSKSLQGKTSEERP